MAIALLIDLDEAFVDKSSFRFLGFFRLHDRRARVFPLQMPVIPTSLSFDHLDRRRFGQRSRRSLNSRFADLSNMTNLSNSSVLTPLVLLFFLVMSHLSFLSSLPLFFILPEEEPQFFHLEFLHPQLISFQVPFNDGELDLSVDFDHHDRQLQQEVECDDQNQHDQRGFGHAGVLLAKADPSFHLFLHMLGLK